jgi:hypothetical protein
MKGPLGTHIVVEGLPSMHARKNGCWKDEKGYPWSLEERECISDVYDKFELLYPDAKVA